jgi:hypothetical protein
MKENNQQNGYRSEALCIGAVFAVLWCSSRLFSVEKQAVRGRISCHG